MTAIRAIVCLFLAGPLLLAPTAALRRRPLHPDRCARFPMDTIRHPREGDNSFEIRVSRGSNRPVEQFEPGKTYRVVIRSSLPAVSFINFYLTTEVEKMSKKNMKLLKPGEDGGRGRFSLVRRNSPAVFLPNCSGVVTAAKSNIQRVELRWTAPTLPQGCVRFLATVIKYRGHYFKDQGKLNRKLCPTFFYVNDEENREQMQRDSREKIEPCCACGTATYKMEFRGTWIRQLHPRDWPEPDGVVHWTNIIGASHDRQYSIYRLGKKASHAVKEVCERGDSSAMESDFKEGSDRILNIIKTRGINGARHMSETRTAIFSVNRTHHLMSMLTMMGPSPDWCTGISSHNLCQKDCVWEKEKKIDLFPWDAGIMQGNTYQATPLREPYQKNIRSITKDDPPGNPFSVDNGRLRPVATLTITRLSPKKNYECERKALPGVTVVRGEQNDGEDPYTRPGKANKQMDRAKELPPNLQAMIPTMCFLTQWSEWSLCSVTCGTGSHMRTRVIERNLKPALCQYVKLREKRPCSGRLRTCDYSKPCSVSAWSTWSPCNATCNGEGHTVRMRFFIRSKEKELCKKKVSLTDYRNCSLQCDDTIICSKPVVSGVQCFKPRTRYYYDMSRKLCLPFTYLGCKGSQNRFRSLRACQRTCTQAFDRMPTWQVQRLAYKQKFESHKARLKQKGKSLRSCKKPMDEGHRCRHKARTLGQTYRWYFDKKSRKCQQMVFKGCSGNDNNFLTEQECKITCAKLLMARRRFNGPPQDCVVDSWGPWSPCSDMCMGKRTRHRGVIKAPLNGGRRCPSLYSYMKCGSNSKCELCDYSSWSKWSPCTVTCGSGLQERTRELKTKGACRSRTPEFVDRVVCTRKPCPKRKSFYVN